MRVALYMRVSKDDGKMDHRNQLIQLEEFCNRKGWKVVKQYVDHMSGKTLNRPQFAQMFKDARLKRFDTVVFWSLDRFSRSGVLDTLQKLQELTSYGVNWVSHEEQYIDSLGIFKDVVVSLMATIAQQERVRISDRTKAGLARAKRQGVKLGRRTVKVDMEKIHKLQDEGVPVRTIAERTGYSLSTIMRSLRAERESVEAA
jgi:DNA invertase Pin-like site-specific DNA recombinase